MTMALIAEAAIDQLRKRLALPEESWDAEHLAKAYFFGLEGDVYLDNNTIIVTYYNAPDADKAAGAILRTCAGQAQIRRTLTRGFLGSMSLNSIFASDESN